MEGSTVLFITLIVCLFSIGSLIQTSHSLDNSDSVQINRSTDRNNNAFIMASDSVEGNGHNVDSAASRQLNITHIPVGHEGASDGNQPWLGITLTRALELSLPHLRAQDRGADKAYTSITAPAHPSVHVISESAFLEGRHMTAEEQFKDTRASRGKDDSLDGGDSLKRPVQTNLFTSLTNRNSHGPGGPCVLGLRPCVVLKNQNGTNLLWDDMSRTLAFVWELHVFGCASLFILMAVLAVLGMASACILPHSLCHALTLENSLLVMGGTLRGVLLLLDPYGTHQILSRATLAALHNVPLQLLLWAQVALALVTLEGLKLFFFPPKLQRPWVVGGLAISHCTPLLVADLYSTTLCPALPLLLQTLSLCWGLPFCMGILTKSLSYRDPFLMSSVPQWFPSHRIDRRAKRVTAVCAFFGVLCCSLQMYSLLWLYGLLGNWRRFGWGWWLSQFWARILELSWGFSLLVLGSWIFWMPSNGESRADYWPIRFGMFKGMEEKSLWCRFLANVRKGPLRKSEKTWEELMPNNWAKYNLARANVSYNIRCPYDDQPSIHTVEYPPDAVHNSNSDSQPALLWQKVGERQCILSLIEFEMRPPSPINLRRSIHNALHHEHLEGPLSTPTSWTHTEANHGDTTSFPPTYVRYGWLLDTESISASLDHFQVSEQILSPSATADYSGSIGSQTPVYKGGEFNSELSAMMHRYDKSNDVTDL
ncbi:proline-rich transmembrane protein 3-like isoform X1 [Hippoglossus hippoglossus]|uniref:proline-rich transmembrane protein 3-like isoform X1 n=2 Tax=Hippoglossus hippoglossus TaxID=8267 RepID=UPI00148DE624|nr:proline-rich transmembrane protein 3-like isoform X1 [Hippoglossus hippoglossus]